MSDAAIGIARLFLAILPYVALLAAIFMAGRSKSNGNKHDQIVWLLWAIMIWLMVIVVDQLGVGL